MRSPPIAPGRLEVVPAILTTVVDVRQTVVPLDRHRPRQTLIGAPRPGKARKRAQSVSQSCKIPISLARLGF